MDFLGVGFFLLLLLLLLPFFFWTFFLGFVLSWISISYLIVSTANRLLSCCLSHLWLVMYKMTTNHQLGQKEQMAVHFFLSIPSNFFNCVFFFLFLFCWVLSFFFFIFFIRFFHDSFCLFSIIIIIIIFSLSFFLFQLLFGLFGFIDFFFCWVFVLFFFVFLIALFRFPCLTWDLSRFQLLKSMVSARWRRRRGRGEIVSAAGARWRQPPATPTAAR